MLKKCVFLVCLIGVCSAAVLNLQRVRRANVVVVPHGTISNDDLNVAESANPQFGGGYGGFGNDGYGGFGNNGYGGFGNEGYGGFGNNGYGGFGNNGGYGGYGGFENGGYGGFGGNGGGHHHHHHG